MTRTCRLGHRAELLIIYDTNYAMTASALKIIRLSLQSSRKGYNRRFVWSLNELPKSRIKTEETWRGIVLRKILVYICLIKGMNEYSNLACKLMIYNLALDESEWKEYISCKLARRRHANRAIIIKIIRKHAIRSITYNVKNMSSGVNLWIYYVIKDWGMCGDEVLRCS